MAKASAIVWLKKAPGTAKKKQEGRVRRDSKDCEALFESNEKRGYVALEAPATPTPVKSQPASLAQIPEKDTK